MTVRSCAGHRGRGPACYTPPSWQTPAPRPSATPFTCVTPSCPRARLSWRRASAQLSGRAAVPRQGGGGSPRLARGGGRPGRSLIEDWEVRGAPRTLEALAAQGVDLRRFDRGLRRSDGRARFGRLLDEVGRRLAEREPASSSIATRASGRTAVVLASILKARRPRRGTVRGLRRLYRPTAMEHPFRKTSSGVRLALMSRARPRPGLRSLVHLVRGSGSSPARRRRASHHPRTGRRRGRRSTSRATGGTRRPRRRDGDASCERMARA